MILTVGAEIVGTVAVSHLVVVSQHVRLLGPAFALCARDALALRLWLAHAELFRDKAVLDHLVDILFLGEWALVVEIHVAHLLTNVWLVHALGVMANEAVVDETLPNEGAVNAVCVRSRGSLLVTTARLDLVFTQ